MKFSTLIRYIFRRILRGNALNKEIIVRWQCSFCQSQVFKLTVLLDQSTGEVLRMEEELNIHPDSDLQVRTSLNKDFPFNFSSKAKVYDRRRVGLCPWMHVSIAIHGCSSEPLFAMTFNVISKYESISVTILFPHINTFSHIMRENVRPYSIGDVTF